MKIAANYNEENLRRDCRRDWKHHRHQAETATHEPLSQFLTEYRRLRSVAATFGVTMGHQDEHDVLLAAVGEELMDYVMEHHEYKSNAGPEELIRILQAKADRMFYKSGTSTTKKGDGVEKGGSLDSSALALQDNGKSCELCGKPGHSVAKCHLNPLNPYARTAMITKALEKLKQDRENQGKGSGQKGENSGGSSSSGGKGKGKGTACPCYIKFK